MRGLVYFSLFDRKFYATANGSAWNPPALAAFQDWTLGVRFLDKVDGSLVEVFPDVRGVSASIGYVDRRPLAGTLKLKIGIGASTPANTTAAFDWNASAEAVTLRLNALIGKPCDFTVCEVYGSLEIRRVDGAALDLEVITNRLFPISFGVIRGYQVDGEWVYELRPTQAPLAFASDWARLNPLKPILTTKADGFSISEVFLSNEVQKLEIPPDFRGLYYILRPSTSARTRLLSQEDQAEQIQEAIQADLMAEGETVVVTNPTTGVAYIEFQGDLAGVDVEQFEVVLADAPPGDVAFTFDLGRPEMGVALRQSDELKSVPLQVTFQIMPEGADPMAAPEPHTSERVLLTLTRPVAWEALAQQVSPSYLRPPNGRSYLPFDDSQVGVGQLFYPEVVGDGATTHFEIDHNLGSAILTGYVVMDNVTKRIMVNGVDYTVSAPSENTLAIDFTEAPNVDGVVIAVATPQGLDVFLAGLMLEIAQINGLQDLLDSMGTAIAELQSILPATGPGISAQAGSIEIQIPARLELFQAAERASVIKVLTDLKLADGEPTKIPEVPLSLLPRPPHLLHAVHDATPMDFDGSDPLPEPETQFNQVLRAMGAAIELGSAGGIRGTIVEEEGYVASDGRSWFAVSGDPAVSRSFYPVAFDRDLINLDINDRMLRVGTTFDLRFSIALQMLKANTRAQYYIEIQTCAYGAQSGLGLAFGPNIAEVNWATSGLTALSYRLILDSTNIVHSFGLRIKRSVSGLTADKILYGTAEGGATPPAGPNFALRARLTKFDVEDRWAPVGFVYLGLVNAKATISA